MNSSVVAVVSGAVTDMIEVSALNGHVLEPGVAFSLLQVSMFGSVNGSDKRRHDPRL